MAKITIDQAIKGFRSEAAPMVATCEWKKIRQVYARWTAQARTSNENDQFEVVTAMKDTLRELLHAPSQKLQRGFFDDI